MGRVFTLTERETEYLFRITDSSTTIFRRNQFFLWAQGEVQSLLPHGVLTCIFDEGSGFGRGCTGLLTESFDGIKDHVLRVPVASTLSKIPILRLLLKQGIAKLRKLRNPAKHRRLHIFVARALLPRARSSVIAVFESYIRMLKADYSGEGIASGGKRHILFIGALRY